MLLIAAVEGSGGDALWSALLHGLDIQLQSLLFVRLILKLVHTTSTLMYTYDLIANSACMYV